MNTPGGPHFASVRTLLLCLLAALAAVACGQRGPLYLPSSEPQPEPRSAPATQPTDPAQEDEGEEDQGEVSGARE